MKTNSTFQGVNLVATENARQGLHLSDLKQRIAAGIPTRFPLLTRRQIQKALHEAEALAWETPHPQLVFPILAEEKLASIHGSNPGDLFEAANARF